MAHVRLLVTAGGLALALAGQARADAGDLQRAEAALAAGRPRVARVELLNAIADDPADPIAHLLQGRAYVAIGDGISAEGELNRARQKGMAPGRTRPWMAEALLLQGEADRALAEASARDVPASLAGAATRARAKALLALGDTDAAEPLFDRAIRVAPGDPRNWVELGRYRIAIGDLAGAVDAADRAVALGPRDVPALALKGELSRTQYGLRTALPWFDQALAIDPENVPALLERAKTLGDLGRNRAMLAAARQVILLDPGNPTAFYLQAVLAARARRFDLARAILDRTGGRLDDLPAAMLLRGVIELQTGNEEQAIERISRLVALQPDNIKARRVLGAAQWRAGDLVGTVETLQPVADLPQADSYTLTLIGRALERQGDRRAAARYLDRAALPERAIGIGAAPVDPARIAQLRQAAAERPNDANARIALIRALLRTRDRDGALAEAVAVQRRYPGAPQAHVIVGDALAEMGRWSEAADAYRRAANISFSEPIVIRLIDAFRQAGNLAAAEQVLGIFVEQNPRNIAGQLLVADFAMGRGDWARAIGIYQGLRDRLGDNDAAMLNNLAWAHFMIGQGVEGLAHAERAYRIAPGNPAVADTLGWLLFKLGGDRGRGLRLIARAAAQAPRESGVQWHLAQALADSGRPAEARHAAEAALGLPGFDGASAARALLARLPATAGRAGRASAQGS